MAVEKDPLQDLKNQFAEMHESLDEIAKNTEPPAEVAKAHIHERRTSAPNQKVDLGKETKKQILDALKNIKNQIVVSQHRENTMSDVAAEALASGQSLAGAAKEALGFKRDKLKASFKRMFDPLNIVHRITGGSKLATVLAGKAMGRSEQSIRSAAGLQPLAETPTPFMGGQDSGAPSAVGSDKAIPLLDKMSTSLTGILERLTELKTSSEYIKESTGSSATSLGEIKDLTQEMRDEARDAGAVEKSRFKKAPTQVNKAGAPVKSDEGGWFSSLMKFLIPALILFGKWIADKIIPLFVKLHRGALYFLDKLMDIVRFIGKFTGGALTKGLDVAKNVVGSIGKGAASLAGKLLGAAPKIAEVAGGAAAAKGAGAIGGKIAQGAGSKVIESAMKGPVVKEVIKDIGGKVLGKTVAKSLPIVGPLIGGAFAIKSFMDGDYTQAAIDAGMAGASLIPGPGSIVAFGAGLAATIANQAYKQIYGIEPGQDPEVAKRMPELVEESKNFVKDFLSPKVSEGDASIEGYKGPGAPQPVGATTATTETQTTTSTPTSPMELPAPAPSSGQTLTQANDLQRNAATETPGGGRNTAAVINNVSNQVTNAPTFNQGMPPARSGESSYQRSLDRHYVPA
jgi:hypothetical protein